MVNTEVLDKGVWVKSHFRKISERDVYCILHDWKKVYGSTIQVKVV